MKQLHRAVLLPLLVVLAAFPSLPQQKKKGDKSPASVAAPAQADSADQTIRATVNVVIAPTTVTDGRGLIVNGLKPQEFKLYDNDKLQEISQDIGFLPLSLVICIQKSANVEAILPKIKKMGTVLHDMLVGQDGEAAIIAFDHRIVTLQDFTNETEKITAALDQLRPGGQNSRMIDAVNQGIRMLKDKKDRRKVILLISETLDRSSESSFREVATNTQLFNVDVYTLNINRLISSLTAKPGLPRPNPMPPAATAHPGIASEDPTTLAQMTGSPGYGVDFVPVIKEVFIAVKAIFVDNPAEVLTKFTGGKEYSFVSQGDLERAIGDIGYDLRSQYLLSYNPNNKLEGGFHRIYVEVMRPGLKVRTRPGYWMAAVPE
jgi:VWFA-related protein